MDYTSILYDPIYAVQGVPALLNLGAHGMFDGLTALDDTAGQAVVSGAIDVQTMLPVAKIRAAELAAKGAQIAWLDGGTVTLNGVTWTITSHRVMPSPGGPSDGEIVLLLEGDE